MDRFKIILIVLASLPAVADPEGVQGGSLEPPPGPRF